MIHIHLPANKMLFLKLKQVFKPIKEILSGPTPAYYYNLLEENKKLKAELELLREQVAGKIYDL